MTEAGTAVSVRQSEVDGVRTFWVPSRSRTLRASLLFRMGMSDLTLTHHGRLHLLEHLALHGRESVSSPSNGEVGLLHTAFDIAGRPEQVVDFFTRLCRWLADPHFDDLDHERRVLTAEARQNVPGATARHLAWRYGARGPGVAAFWEYGLQHANADGLRTLAQEAFVSGNAVLALSGEPPADLRLPLREGRRRPTSVAVGCQQPLPGGFTDAVNGVGLSGAVSRSTAATAFGRALHRELQRDIRGHSGMGYSAWSAYEVVDAETAVIATGMDILAEGRAGLVDRVQAQLRRLTDQGPNAADFVDDIEMTVRHFSDPSVDPWWSASAAARADVLGGEPFDPDQQLDQLRCLTMDDLRQVAGQFQAGMLIGVDRGTDHGTLQWLDLPPNGRRIDEGRSYHAIERPVDLSVLTVGPRQIRMQDGDRWLTADPAEVEAAVAYGDGGRILIRSDGYQLSVEPSLWRQGHAAVKAIDALIPVDRVVAMPARPADRIPQPTVSRRDRNRYRLELTVTHPVVLAMIAVLFGVTGVTDLAHEGAYLFGPAVLAGVGAYYSSKRWRSRRRGRDRSRRRRG
jgi:zinc protease